MQKLYKYLLLICAVSILVLGGYVYYKVTYDTGIVKIAGFVNDHTQRLSADYVTSIETASVALSQKAKVDIVTVMLDTTGPFEPPEYAETLLRNYESSRPDIAGAIVLLIDIKKGRICLGISPRIQLIVSKEFGEKVIDTNIVPMFNDANKVLGEMSPKPESQAKASELMGQGVLEGVRALAQKVNEEYAKQKFAEEMIKIRKQEDENAAGRLRFSYWFYLGLAFLVMLIILIVKVQFRLRCPKCYYRMKITEETIEVPENDKPGLSIEVVACNHCGFADTRRIVTYARSFYLAHLYEVIIDVVKSYYRRRKREIRKKSYTDKD